MYLASAVLTTRGQSDEELKSPYWADSVEKVVLVVIALAGTFAGEVDEPCFVRIVNRRGPVGPITETCPTCVRPAIESSTTAIPFQIVG